MPIGFTSGSSGSDSDLSDSAKTERRSPHGITVTQTLTSTPTSLPHPHFASTFLGESAHAVSSGMTNQTFTGASKVSSPAQVAPRSNFLTMAGRGCKDEEFCAACHEKEVRLEAAAIKIERLKKANHRLQVCI